MRSRFRDSLRLSSTQLYSCFGYTDTTCHLLVVVVTMETAAVGRLPSSSIHPHGPSELTSRQLT